jgi:hypothetical protein
VARTVRIPNPGAVCLVMNRGGRRHLVRSRGRTSAVVALWPLASHTKKYDNFINGHIYTWRKANE